MKALVCLICVAMAGCSTYETLCQSQYVQGVRSLECEQGFACFEYHFVANYGSGAETDGSEQARVNWIGRSLRSNGCDDAQMEITQRRPVLREKTILGVRVHDLYYTVRAPKLE